MSFHSRYLMYVAESPENLLMKYLYMGTFGETSRATRPVIVIYEIATLKFEVVDTIPQFYSPGSTIWKHDSNGIIGTVWWNNPYPMGCPSCTNRKSQVTEIATKHTSEALA